MTDPTIGVWISEDGEVGAPDPRNLYRMEGNNPTNEVDPTGEFSIKGAVGLVWDSGLRFVTGEEPGILVKVGQMGAREIGVVAVNKAVISSHWRQLSYQYGDKAGKPISGMMFRWSLQKNPSKLTFRTNSPVVAAIKASAEYKNGIGKCVAEAIKENKTHGYVPVGFTSNDLATSIGNGTLEYKVVKIKDSSNYELQVRVYDRFNFELHPFFYYRSMKMGGANNASWLLQYLDVINGYDWNTEWWTEKSGIVP